MPVVEVRVLPIGTDEASISSYIQDCFEIASSALGVEAVLTPTATLLEGDLDDVLPVVEAMHQSPFYSGVDRVITNVTIDERLDKPLDMDGMVDSVLHDDVLTF
ncbi:MTH1187 family thiamine-binding protein [Sulfobacillus harzensis]|uniref:MTH1187 family thiamine-binding protein n=1 Tax=Sulfobacillus harzensis TaxID=2729629 RepID=A0A7Y0L0Y1_9FIRM|nr:MTH1187 family thiamine-binding protein [Sulfobacillus harzensis]NMP21284.1 MTH1187 family thiamine-binding protein [Sulfobacillus harzensis]